MTIQIDAWENRLLANAYGPLENQLRHGKSARADRAQLRQAFAQCTAITREHSHTFYMASSLMPTPQREAIRALYAFCRISDDLVDEGNGDKEALLRDWQRRTSEAHPSSDDPVELAWSDVRSRYEIPAQYATQLLAGVSRDLTQNRYETFDDLAEYCYAVASTVGLMTMHIVGYSGREAIPYAVKLGVALQLTNILRDVAEDWQKGRLYLPQEELSAFGLGETDIASFVENAGEDGPLDERWLDFMRFQVERARRLYAEALPGIKMLGKSGRFAVAAAAELYQAILDEIESNGFDVFSQRAHVSGLKKVTRLPGIWRRAHFGSYQERNTPNTESGQVRKRTAFARKPENAR